MSDLLTAVAVMSTFCVAAGFLAAGCASSSPSRTSRGFLAKGQSFLAKGQAFLAKGQRTMLLLAISVLAAVCFQFYGSGQLFWAKLVPSSAAIIYTNFASVFAALAAGWALRLPGTPRWRRIILSVGLSSISAVAILWPLLSIGLRPPPDGGNEWHSGVALQTSWATCSPAAAATLLRSEGMEISEAELIPLCLTDSAGTPTLGLYRGVKLVAARNDRSVEVLEGGVEDLLRENDWPVLLAVELPYGADDRRYVDQWGWIPGMGHSVVVLEQVDNGSVIVGDPSAGLESWTKDDLRVLWHGDGMRVR